MEIIAQLTIKSYSRFRVAPLHLQKLHCSVVKRKMWIEEAMDNATNNVMEGTLSDRYAAAQYDMSSSTLLDRISGKMSATVGLHVAWMSKKKKNC